MTEASPASKVEWSGLDLKKGDRIKWKPKRAPGMSEGKIVEEPVDGLDTVTVEYYLGHTAKRFELARDRILVVNRL